MRAELITRAEERGLGAMARALSASSHEWTAAGVDLDLRMPLKASLEADLASLTRRGLRLADVDSVLQAFRASPVEQGLIAWSFLKGHRVAQRDAARAKELFKLAAHTFSLVADPAENWLKLEPQPLLELLVRDAVTAGIADTPLGLARLEGIRRDGGQAALDEGRRLAAVREAAWTLALGRLSSLALAYFLYLWKVGGYPTAMLEYCELALDERAYALLPSTADWEGLHVSFVPVRGYVEGRTKLVAGDLPGAKAALSAMPAEDDDGYRIVLASEIDLPAAGTDTQVRRLEDICRKRPLWKHAQRVRTIATIHRDAAMRKPATEIVRHYAQFEGTFGFDGRTFLLANVAVPRQHEARALLEGRLVRNLLEMPYDHALWVDLAARLPERDALWAELKYRRQIEGT